MAKIIAFDEEARRGLERGMNVLADAVKVACDATVALANGDVQVEGGLGHRAPRRRRDEVPQLDEGHVGATEACHGADRIN